ncbi:hypothetical protein [Candidatus Methylobacter oryzae]|uniref:Uncharacterized protein n=1 Tax=Candidatus Methylobacter oryzae TaxID=2497749 RepID=A0ABY3CBX5_9GAMM|nr:hypothetical protein [Candidatus Methylobacter oryzae]TRW96155.1 hypothetical protein EKO24_009070 [Candidatus Methylobacter oryzae]
MNIKQWLQADYLPIPLIALMALTRFHHFGDVLHLPDASLAVFFFAGFYRNKAFFAFLLVLAGLIDAIAIANGTSSWCVSPSYVFLIPTYAVMWFAGRYCSAFKSLKPAKLAVQFGVAALATSTAFAISNGSFYLFSGRYPDLSWGQYFSRVAQYYPPYVSSALLYMILGYGVMKLVKSLATLAPSHKEV